MVERGKEFFTILIRLEYNHLRCLAILGHLLPFGELVRIEPPYSTRGFCQPMMVPTMLLLRTYNFILNMDIEEIGGAFVSGLVTSPLINTLFPIIVSMYFTNSESLPFLTKWLFRAVPFVLLFVLFFSIVDSIESFVAGVLGLLFSIAVFGNIGIVGLVTMAAIFVVVAIKITRMQ